jgi:hypothetical protein
MSFIDYATSSSKWPRGICVAQQMERTLVLVRMDACLSLMLYRHVSKAILARIAERDLP